MQVDLVARLDRAEEILVVVDPEVGMMTALHQETGTTEGDGLLDLLEDHGLRKQVALARVAGASVEGAKVAVGVAYVRVVEVSVDDEGDAIGIRLAVADLVRDTTDGNEVAGLEQGQRFGVGKPLAVERPLEDVRNGALRELGALSREAGHATTASRTKRSSGTSPSSPVSCASSRKVISPARSRGPKRYRSFSK